MWLSLPLTKVLWWSKALGLGTSCCGNRWIMSCCVLFRVRRYQMADWRRTISWRFSGGIGQCPQIRAQHSWHWEFPCSGSSLWLGNTPAFLLVKLPLGCCNSLPWKLNPLLERVLTLTRCVMVASSNNFLSRCLFSAWNSYYKTHSLDRKSVV